MDWFFSDVPSWNFYQYLTDTNHEYRIEPYTLLPGHLSCPPADFGDELNGDELNADVTFHVVSQWQWSSSRIPWASTDGKALYPRILPRSLPHPVTHVKMNSYLAQNCVNHSGVAEVQGRTRMHSRLHNERLRFCGQKETLDVIPTRLSLVSVERK